MAPLRRRRDRGFEREESLEERLDLLDVPAAVVCVLCGEADCPGCSSDKSRSGIVAIVAWERANSPMLSRLWSTARSTTRDAEGFFELLPDGPLMPALRFAATCELLATTAVFLGWLAAIAIIAPDWLKSIALDPHSRSIAGRAVVLGIPAFAALLVLAHAGHGLSIDLGAKRNGGSTSRSRALRFGLYACGWDLVQSPIGGITVAIKEGWSAAIGLLGTVSGLPTRSTIAFLRGCYQLEGERARSALGTSYAGAAFVTLAFALIVLAAVTAAIFA